MPDLAPHKIANERFVMPDLAPHKIANERVQAGDVMATDPRWRDRHGECRGCGAAESEWCQEGCPLLDPTDYR